ncbi:DUF4917 family protein, partial [Bacillus paranthracis]|uniref:DUF4917 family protein n=1 Tax=Bacillus paranthracis TaxID=2026186 RepID=UPI0015829C7D
MTKSLVSYQELVHNNRTFYLDNLLFGNGFSMHFNSGFSYNNLYEESKNLFNIEDEKMFELFNTRNFELVLKALYTAIKTNYVFDIKDEQVNSSYKRIKSGLIDAVRKVHPQLEELHPNKERQLKWAFMLFKKSIFTTNYDLLPYWALLSRGVQGVSDGFGFDKKSRQIMFGKGAGSSDESPLELYYLHGALHFVQRQFNRFRVKSFCFVECLSLIIVVWINKI